MMAQIETAAPFDVIQRVAGNVLECASKFRDFAGNPEGRAGSYAAIVQGARQAREDRAAAVRALNGRSAFRRNYRPIGRLIEQVIPIPALVEKAAARMRTYRIGTPPGKVLELGRCLEEASGIVLRASEPLEQNDHEGMAKIAADLRARVVEADEIGTKGLSVLFETSADPLEILKLKDVYPLLGEILRRFQVTANLLEDMAQGAE